MRTAVKSLMAAVVITAAMVQHDADAALYDVQPLAAPSADVLKLTISYPYPVALGLAPAAAAPVTPEPSAFAPEMAMFALAPERLAPFDAPLAVAPAATATPTLTIEPRSQPAPADRVPEVKPAETTPELMPPDTVMSVPGDVLPKPRPREIAPRARSRATDQRLRRDAVRIEFDTPTLAPLAHTRFCLRYPGECRVHKIRFRGGAIDLTADRRQELLRVNADVNRSIRAVHVNETPVNERWLISPSEGDCNDYAVTKRHKLLAEGWPARNLLLAEVVTDWGEHHLVLVVRTDRGDLVADNLSVRIRSFDKTPYQWVRVQSPENPKFWSTIKPPQADMVATAGSDTPL